MGVTMVSATFGNEMWSARNIGKQRLEKSIAVRQGMTIDFVFESTSDKKLFARKKANDKANAEAKKMSRLQAQLAAEVEAEQEGQVSWTILIVRRIVMRNDWSIK